MPQVHNRAPVLTHATTAYNVGREAFIAGIDRKDNPYRDGGCMAQQADWFTGHAHEELDFINRPMKMRA